MENNQNLNSKKFGEKPIFKLLLEMSAPAIISMLVLSLYNIVDSIFVAKYNTKALDALSIVFPMQQILIAFAVGVGVGTNAYVSRKLGQGKVEEANLTAQTGLFIALIISVIFIFIGWFLARPFVSAYTDDLEVIKMGVTYLRTVICLSFGCVVEMLSSKVLQATGNMIIPMVTQIVGAIVNIILDPIFIFVCNWGILGAAIATVLGQFIAMAISLSAYIFHKQDVNIMFNKKFRLKASVIKGIIKIGLPIAIMNSISAFVVTIVNLVIKKYLYAITVLGVYFKLQSFAFMPVFGLTQGALPILSYNYGGNNKERFIKTFKLSLVTALIIMALCTLITQLIPDKLMMMFASDKGMVDLAKIAFRVLSISFIFAAIGIVCTTMLQALRMGFLSLIMSLLRQLILLVPMALLFSYLWGVNGVWYAYPASEAIVAIIFVIITAPLLKKKFKKENLLDAEEQTKCEEQIG